MFRSFCLLLLAVLPVAAQDTDGDGIPDRAERVLGTPVERANPLTEVLRDDDDPNAGGPGQALDVAAVSLGHIGADRWLWRVDFFGTVEQHETILILYVDADDNPRTGRQDKPEVLGTDLMYTFSSGVGGEQVNNPTTAAARPGRARYLLVGESLYICDDIRYAGTATGKLRMRFLSQRPGSSDASEFVAIEVARTAETSVPDPERPSGAEFRGLSGAALTPRTPRPALPREQPPVPFATVTKAGRPNVGRATVPVEVRTETAAAHRAWVTFGLPLPQGAVFARQQIDLLDGAESLPIDVALTSFWPDGSVRWALVEAAVPFGASATKELTAAYGGEVDRTLGHGISQQVNEESITIDTGAATATVTLAPVGLGPVSVEGQAVLAQGWFELIDREGTRYAPYDAVATLEYDGERKSIWRLEAPYRSEAGETLFRAIVRLTFRADSPVIDLAHTLINDNLAWEFTDLSALRLALVPAGSVDTAAFAVGDGDVIVAQPVTPGPAATLEVPHDQHYNLSGKTVEGRTVGLLDAGVAGGPGLAVGVVDFWQRYPKALRIAPDQIRVDLLPSLSGGADPGDLPEHLAFPYVDGAYRFKWGMASTERIRLTPYPAGGRALAQAAARDATTPPVAVVPAEHYAATGALGEMAASDGELFAGWDEAFAKTFEAHLSRKDVVREYGFFNWGDWHGEREFNWGNNEYDLAHGLFLQFARTGRRDYYRLALAAARHQADVDLIQAYPDPFYIGGNLPHSYAHTGEWSQDIKERQWSFPYGPMASGANGHTWANGMVDAWFLAGEPRVMEAAQSVGEQIAFRMAPEFTELGTHERSAGWSAHALAALYEATRDPAYLAAMERILGIAYQEQKFEQGGAWPHLLPQDHAGGVPGATGNVSFLIGVLGAAIDDHYSLTESPEAKRSLAGAADWLRTQWVPEVDAFQYTSSPAYRASANRSLASLNTLTLPAVLRVAEETRDPELLALAANAFAATYTYGMEDFGKSLGQVAHFAPRVMARLARLGAATEPWGRVLRRSPDEIRESHLLAVGPPAQLALRGPIEKTVIFHHPGGAAAFTAARQTWGAMPQNEATGFAKLIGPDGAEVASERFDTDVVPWTFTAELPATAEAGDYRLQIHDDLRARWDVTGPAQRVVKLDPPVQFGGLGSARWYFQVPAGTRQFSATIVANHDGAYGLYLFAPDGSIAGRTTGSASRTAGRGGTVTVTVPAGQDDQIWSLLCHAKMDLTLSLDGVPPYLATGPKDWFRPAEAGD